MMKFHRYVSQGHPPDHINHPFARTLQVINNELSQIVAFACIKISLVAEEVDFGSALTLLTRQSIGY